MSVPADSARTLNEKITTFSNKGEKTQLDSSGTRTDPSAHVLDIEELGPEGRGLQTASDGKTILIPQPSSDPNDPLNWSSLKKHLTLLVITVVSFLPDFGSSIGIVALLPQAGYVVLGEDRRRKLR